MKSMNIAPRDGRLINLYRERGDIHIGRYAEKMSIFRKGKQWIDLKGNMLEVSINPIIGWDKI